MCIFSLWSSHLFWTPKSTFGVNGVGRTSRGRTLLAVQEGTVKNTRPREKELEPHTCTRSCHISSTCKMSSRSNCRHIVSISHVLTTRSPFRPDRRLALESRGPYMPNAYSLPVDSGCWSDFGKMKSRSSPTSTLPSRFLAPEGRSSEVLSSFGPILESSKLVCVEKSVGVYHTDTVLP